MTLAPDADAADYLGYRITVSCVRAAGDEREPFVIRALAAASLWGMQEELWRWEVTRGDSVLASGEELSEVAALEEAKHWIRETTSGVE